MARSDDPQAVAQALVSIIKSCSHLAAKEKPIRGCDGNLVKIHSLERAMAIHSYASHHSLDWNMYVATSLVNLYAKSGSMAESQRLFDAIPQHNVVAWTSLIAGYAQNGHGATALEKFSEMHSRGGASPNAQTFVAALQACSSIVEDREFETKEQICEKHPALISRVLENGMALHSEAVKRGLESDVYVGNSLIDVYGKCASLEDAWRVFERMPARDIVTWNSLMTGYALNGHPRLALDLFFAMDCPPSAQTFAILLKAAGQIGALQAGKLLHAKISRLGCLNCDELVTNSLVDFYGKSGSTMDAQRVFDFTSASGCSIVTWNALLAGYSRKGDTALVLCLFESLVGEGRRDLRPNGLTFSALLAACSHVGLVDKGLEHFDSMVSKYGVAPDARHYHCVVDMLGRANRLLEAVKMVKVMPCKPNSVAWMTVLGACHKWKNVDLGRLAFDALVCRQDEELMATSGYVIMASIYARAGMWEKKLEIDAMRSEKSVSLSEEQVPCSDSPPFRSNAPLPTWNLTKLVQTVEFRSKDNN